MQEQVPWIAALQGHVGGLEKEITDTSAAIAAELKQLGLDGGEGPLLLPSLSARSMALLRSAARAIGPCRQRVVQAHSPPRLPRRRPRRWPRRSTPP